MTLLAPSGVLIIPPTRCVMHLYAKEHGAARSGKRTARDMFSHLVAHNENYMSLSNPQASAAGIEVRQVATQAK